MVPEVQDGALGVAGGHQVQTNRGAASPPALLFGPRMGRVRLLASDLVLPLGTDSTLTPRPPFGPRGPDLLVPHPQTCRQAVCILLAFGCCPQSCQGWGLRSPQTPAPLWFPPVRPLPWLAGRTPPALALGRHRPPLPPGRTGPPYLPWLSTTCPLSISPQAVPFPGTLPQEPHPTFSLSPGHPQTEVPLSHKPWLVPFATSVLGTNPLLVWSELTDTIRVVGGPRLPCSSGGLARLCSIDGVPQKAAGL